MKALILAGRQPDGPLAHINPNKGIIKIHEKEMILYVIDAVKSLEEVEEIVVVGNDEDLCAIRAHVDTILPEGGGLPENVLIGVSNFSDDEDVLVLTSDIPMITTDALRDFVKRAKGLSVDFAYPVVQREVNDKKYPGVQRTYVRLKDGSFTGGNIFLVKAGAIRVGMEKAKSFLSYRKRPWKMVQILGIGFALRFLLGTLTISQLEERVSRLFGIVARAVISDYPELGTDVDKVSDLDLASAQLLRKDF